MTDSMDMPAAVPAGGSNNTRRNTIIAVVVGAVLLCCCCLLAVGLALAWSCGDVLMGIANECSPLFP